MHGILQTTFGGVQALPNSHDGQPHGAGGRPSIERAYSISKPEHPSEGRPIHKIGHVLGYSTCTMAIVHVLWP